MYQTDLPDDLRTWLTAGIDDAVEVLERLRAFREKVYLGVTWNATDGARVNIQADSPEQARRIKRALGIRLMEREVTPRCSDGMEERLVGRYKTCEVILYAIPLKCEPIYKDVVIPAEPRHVVTATPEQTLRRLVGHDCGIGAFDLAGKPLAEVAANG